MRGYNFVYFLSEGIKGIFKHGFMSFAAVCAILACLVIMGSFSLLAFNVNEAIGRVAQENEVFAYIDDSLSDNEALATGTKIYALENVETAVFVTKEEAFEDYMNELGEDSYLAEGLKNEDVLRHRYRIFLRDLEQLDDTVQKLRDIDGIARVDASLELSQGIISFQNVVNIITYIIAAVLLSVSVFIVSNTIKLAAFDRREEIAIMKMVGAENGFVRWPFVFEGFLLGLVGGALAFFCQWGIYGFALRRISEYSGFIALIKFSDISFTLLVIFLTVGFIVGIGGSILSIRKFMKV